MNTDGAGNEIKRQFLGVDEKPARGNEGYLGWTAKYEGRRQVEIINFGYDGKLGFKKKLAVFDELGRVAKVVFLDDSEQPVLDDSQVAGWTNEFDERGNLIGRTYIGLNGQPIMSKDGYSRMTTTFGPNGQAVDRAYFDLAGKPLVTEVVIEQVLDDSQALARGLKVGDIIAEYDGIEGSMLRIIAAIRRFTAENSDQPEKLASATIAAQRPEDEVHVQAGAAGGKLVGPCSRRGTRRWRSPPRHDVARREFQARAESGQNGLMHSNLSIFEKYLAKTPGSASRHARALEVLAGGVTHDTRVLRPYPLFISRAQGADKWDVDGNQYVDYIGGHGASFSVTTTRSWPKRCANNWRRVRISAQRHDLESEWAEQVQRMVPCAERVRFTGSGTEATMLAIRLARAFTGRGKIIRFAGHFHGWHDQVAFGVTSHFDGLAPPGI